MRIALSGTPGTGKTSVAKELSACGFHVVDLHELAEQQHFFSGVDRKRNSKLLDMTLVNRYIKQHFHTEDTVVFEGLAAHLVKSVEKVIVLRCHPRVLKQRLQQKGWTAEKIHENLEAEALDIILSESVELHDSNDIVEVDTTKKTAVETAEIIKRMIRTRFQQVTKYKIGQLDWSEEILKGL